MNSLLDTLGKSYAGDGKLVLTGIIINSFLERADRAGLVGRAFQGAAIPSEGMARWPRCGAK